MARPLRIVYPGAFYYITSRGNERKDIFKSLTSTSSVNDQVIPPYRRAGPPEAARRLGLSRSEQYDREAA